MRRVLLVEDEVNLSKLIKLNLELEGYEVDHAANGATALANIDEAHYDIVLLDLMLPKVSGMEVLAAIRLKNEQLPVIIVSAKDTSTDRINGLKHGADDYLTKPFEIEELVLRLKKLLDRSVLQSQAAPETIQTELYKFGSNSINFKTFIATNASKSFELSQKEYLILKYLISKKNEVVSRQELLKAVWGYDVYPTTRTIDNFISTLRKYFESDIKEPKYLKSVRGVGYRFVEEM